MQIGSVLKLYCEFHMLVPGEVLIMGQLNYLAGYLNELTISDFLKAFKRV